MSEDLGTERVSSEGEGPREADAESGSKQVVGDDESAYGASGQDGEPGEEGAERGPREQDEDQGI